LKKIIITPDIITTQHKNEVKLRFRDSAALLDSRMPSKCFFPSFDSSSAKRTVSNVYISLKNDLIIKIRST
jgi:hypothetical protein